MWAPAKESAERERAALEAFVAAQGEALEGGIQPWDWRFYAEKVRQSKYDFDEEALKPYLSLEAMTTALLSVSQKLYGRARFVSNISDLADGEHRGPVSI